MAGKKRAAAIGRPDSNGIVLVSDTPATKEPRDRMEALILKRRRGQEAAQNPRKRATRKKPKRKKPDNGIVFVGEKVGPPKMRKAGCSKTPVQQGEGWNDAASDPAESSSSAEDSEDEDYNPDI